MRKPFGVLRDLFLLTIVWTPEGTSTITWQLAHTPAFGKD
jgi:hypothetical protein